MPENDRDKNNTNNTLDLTKDAEYFKNSVRRYVLNRTITGLIVRKDCVEIHLDTGQMITCTIIGPDISIKVPAGPSVTTLDGTPGGFIM